MLLVTSGKGIVSSGSVVQVLDYYPYGSTRINESSGFNEQRQFASMERDSDTGLDYANARYYDNATGKFISQDPAFWDFSHIQVQLVDPQSWNSYAYAGNNPLKHNDPSGEFPDLLIDAAFTAWDGSKVVQHSGQLLGNLATQGLGKLTGNKSLENLGKQGTSESASSLGQASIDLSISAGATLIPGVPAFVGRTDDVAKLVNRAGGVSKYIDNVDDIISPSRQKHILYGDKTGGGHMFSAKTNKPKFPKNWSPQQILHNAIDVATDPTSKSVLQSHGTHKVTNIKDGVNMTTILNNNKSKIITSFPTVK